MLFSWLKNTAKKTEDAVDKVQEDLNKTSNKMQEVLDEGGNSVKVITKILVIAFGVNILTNFVTMFVGLSKNKLKKTSPITITIQNLYLGDKK